MASTDTERFIRLMLLTFQGGTWICKKVLDREIDNSQYENLVVAIKENYDYLDRLRKKSKLFDSQFDILFPLGGGDTNYEDWDISLVIRIIRLLFPLTLTTYQNEPDLKALSSIRDYICHSGETSLSEITFLQKWSELTVCIKNLAGRFAGAIIKEADEIVKNLSSSPLDIKSSTDKLSELAGHNQELQRKIDKLRQGQEDIKENLSTIKETTNAILAALDKKSMREFTATIPVLKTILYITGDNETMVKEAENILHKSLHNKIENINDPDENEEVKSVVDDYAQGLAEKDAEITSVSKSCIIVNIRFRTLTGLKMFLEEFANTTNKIGLVKIENTLNDLLKYEFQVYYALPEETTNCLGNWIASCLQQSHGMDSPERVVKDSTADETRLLDKSKMQEPIQWDVKGIGFEKRKRDITDVEKKRTNLLKDVEKLCYRFTPGNVERILFIGLTGQGKSSVINTIAKQINGEYYQIATVGSGGSTSKSQEILMYEHCGIVLDSINDEGGENRFLSINDRLPHLIDYAGLQDLDTPQLTELFERFVDGAIPPGTTVQSIERDQEKYKKVGGLKARYGKGKPEWKLSKIVFVHSCKSPVPTRLIKCLLRALHSTDENSTHLKFSGSIFLLITKYDLVEQGLTVSSDGDQSPNSPITMEEFKEVEEELATQFSVAGNLEFNRIRWTNYGSRTGFDNPNVDLIVLEFLKQMMMPTIARDKQQSVVNVPLMVEIQRIALDIFERLHLSPREIAMVLGVVVLGVLLFVSTYAKV